MKIKKGDKVIITSGKDRGKTGKIVRVVPDAKRIAVEGLNLVKRHLRPRRQGQKGQVVSRERLMNAASVALICPSCGKPTRVGYRITGNGKIRICRKCNAEI